MSNCALPRRRFLQSAGLTLGGALLPWTGGCADGEQSDNGTAPQLGEGTFDHGVASGDPSTTSVLLWTRVTPTDERAPRVPLRWEIAVDEAFHDVVANGATEALAEHDFTVKVEASDLTPGTPYWYRFHVASTTSPVGRTRTLVLDPQQVRLGVVSCANYPGGFFHVYRELALRSDLDAIVHLGDYLYEYGTGGYATEDAASLDRRVDPPGDTVTLADYRRRYAQYRRDPDLQAVHAAHPFFAIWDDHEVADNAWRDGAANHFPQVQGDYQARKQAALQAYFEWVPVREATVDAQRTVMRRVDFGDLVSLHLLDTRHLGRDQQLDLQNYVNLATGTFDTEAMTAALEEPTRTLLGAAQKEWLRRGLVDSGARWQVLGQQVVMGRMYLPAAIVLQLLTVTAYAELAPIYALALRSEGGASLTTEEEAQLAAGSAALTPQVRQLLALPSVPYNTDAWDGYAAEREELFQVSRGAKLNLVVLAGDTHNGWANDLTDSQGNTVGVEFAVAAVSSPGIETYLSLKPADVPATEAAIPALVPGVRSCNLSDRGYLIATFTADAATSEWNYISSVKTPGYEPLEERRVQASVRPGIGQIELPS